MPRSLSKCLATRGLRLWYVLVPETTKAEGFAEVGAPGRVSACRPAHQDGMLNNFLLSQATCRHGPAPPLAAWVDCFRVFWLPSKGAINLHPPRVSQGSDKWPERRRSFAEEPAFSGRATPAGGGAAVVFKVGAVLAFIVLRTLAEIVTGTVVALGAVWQGLGSQ